MSTQEHEKNHEALSKEQKHGNEEKKDFEQTSKKENESSSKSNLKENSSKISTQPAERPASNPIEDIENPAEHSVQTSEKEMPKENSEAKKQPGDLESALLEESASVKKQQQKEEEPSPQIPLSSSHQNDVDHAVAEDSEDETTSERHGIEKKDYHSMSQQALADELERLLNKEKVQAIKEHVIDIRAEFNAKFEEELEEKKEDFIADGGNSIDFHYATPIKKRFNSLYFDYKEKRNAYYKQLKQNLNKNLDRRLEIIEELKSLIDVEENINTTYKQFKDLQESWRNAGPVPSAKYTNIWNTYHHHVENFYDFLHLNREFRDLDFKHNLEEKLKVIDRAEDLAQEEDINRAFRELQMLHKMWKEELGPVGKEYREIIWEKFSAATKKIHDRRQEHFKELDKTYEKNWETKQEIIAKITEIAEQNFSSHNKWQQNIKVIEALREDFFKAGKVPKNKNEATWTNFKKEVRKFNRKKNSFYKNLKKDQYDNLEKKKELIEIAEEHKDSEDFKTITPLMKKIQADWKKIGHVPRKDSDKVWKRFKAACNHYFERLHASRDEENKEELEAFGKKKELLDQLKSMELSSNKKEALASIKEIIANWKEIGRVPRNKKFIEGKFNKALDQLFSRLDINHNKAEMLKYENKVQSLNDADDAKKIRNEHYFLSKKVEETKAEIRQLENNLQFFSNANNDNPLVKEVQKNINGHKAQLQIWKQKLDKIKALY